jgi:hypothetical protein
MALFHITWFSAAADGRSAAGTRLGVIAARAGIETDRRAPPQRGGEVEERERRVLEHGADEEDGRSAHEPGLCEQQDAAAVVRVDQGRRRATRRSWGRVDQADRADGRGRSGQAVDLHEQGDHRDLRTGLGDELAAPQEPEVAGFPQRTDVDGEPAGESEREGTGRGMVRTAAGS